MSNFDLDDPLGDLLSDGSDDSFFDNPKVRASSEKHAEKKSVNDVFQLDSHENNVPPRQDAKSSSAEDWLTLGVENSSPAFSKPVKKITFEDQNHVNSLHFEHKNTNETKPQTNRSESAKKVSIMESLLGPTKDEGKKFMSLDDLLQETKALKKQDVPTEITQSATTLTDIQRPQSVGMGSLEAAKEGRRNRPRTANVLDPLGLFPSNSTVPETIPRRGALAAPEELKSQVSTETHKNSTIEKRAHPSTLGNVSNWLGTEGKTNEVDATTPKIVSNVENVISLPAKPNQTMENMLAQQKLATSHVDYQNTTLSLQQHESQLLMALQLKKYEENMADLQKKQQDVLARQEQQFNSLLERQLAKQQTIENNIRLQQERINNHIETLLFQPPITAAINLDDAEKDSELKKTRDNEIQAHYEEIINNLKQKQHNEISLLDESYKKQISTLEQSMESVENHLKMEIDALNQKHREKVELLEDEHKYEVTKYQSKIEEMHKHHESEIKQMRENSNRIVEEIKYEYNTIIENMKNAKTLEHSVLSDANTYSAKLDASLKMLDINSRSLVEIREKVHRDGNVLSEAREESNRAKEREIDQMRDALMKAREAADHDRAQLMSVVRNLEVKLSEQSQNAREERFALQQAAATLTARTSALDREAEFSRQSIERERTQLKVLQETFLAEQEKMTLEITEEKLRLHADKVRLETASKLTHNYDVEKAKVEVEAAVKVAKEAAEMTDKERENLMKQVREVEILKRTLHDKESRLNNFERDLEVAMEHAQRKNMLGEKALDESRMLQMNYNDKLREIQARMSSISMREKKLAEDKIAMSKERLALQNSKRRCGLCAVENQVQDFDNLSDEVEQDLPRFISVNDADMFRLQLQLSEDQLTTGRMNVNQINPR